MFFPTKKLNIQNEDQKYKPKLTVCSRCLPDECLQHEFQSEVDEEIEQNDLHFNEHD
jgi:hypothetical protein